MTAIQVPPTIEPMLLSDLEAVMGIERAVFPTPWSPRAFRYDLSMDEHSHYSVLRGWMQPMPPLLGYIGFWLWDEEAHIGTFAVHPRWQGRGIGKWIMLGAIRQAIKLRVELATLEVRVSNLKAQALYQKLGFETVGRRRHYYSDSGEDALLMTLHGLRRTDRRSELATQRAAARQRLQEQWPAVATMSIPASLYDVSGE